MDDSPTSEIFFCWPLVDQNGEKLQYQIIGIDTMRLNCSIWISFLPGSLFFIAISIKLVFCSEYEWVFIDRERVREKNGMNGY